MAVHHFEKTKAVGNIYLEANNYKRMVKAPNIIELCCWNNHDGTVDNGTDVICAMCIH
jgi:hypothetical protein